MKNRIKKQYLQKQINMQGIQLWNIKSTRTKNVHKGHTHYKPKSCQKHENFGKHTHTHTYVGNYKKLDEIGLEEIGT